MALLRNLAAIVAIAGLTVGLRAGDNLLPLDKDFLVKVASCNNAEIEIAKVAEKRASAPAVRDFATTIVKDHQTAFSKLGDLMKNRKVGVVAGLEKATRDEIARLKNLEGAAFDREFLDHMIKEHKKAIRMFEHQAKSGQEADVRDYAKGLLPDLQKHLKRAEELARQ